MVAVMLKVALVASETRQHHQEGTREGRKGQQQEQTWKGMQPFEATIREEMLLEVAGHAQRVDDHRVCR